MPGHDNCVVPGCPNRRDRCKWGLFTKEETVAGRVVYGKRRLCGSLLDRKGCENKFHACQAVSFFRLPSEKRGDLRKVWISKIPRTNIPLTQNCRVCSVHFDKGSKKCADDVPTIFEGGLVTQKRSTKTSIAAELPLVLDDSGGDGHEQETSGGAAGVFEEPEPDLPVVDPLFEPMPAEVDQAQEIVKLRERVGDLEKVLFHTRLDLQETREIAEKLKFSFTKLKSDPVAFQFFTGITVESFKDILRILGDAVNTMLYAYDVPDDHEGKKYTRGSRALSVEDELLLTLVKLRHNFPESDLALRFGISQSTVSRIFCAWIRCLYHSFREIPIWPPRKHIDIFMPESFKAKYPTTRVIIDATEFHIEKPANPDVQAATWSNYKNTNTLKLLVGVTPNGVISFLSDLWGGRISDKELTKRSKLLDLIQPGDSIMADRGFDLDTIMPEGTRVNIPHFLVVGSSLMKRSL